VLIGRNSGGNPAPVPASAGAMEGNAPYSSNEMVPMAMAFYEGKEVYFIHPEASDAGVAEVLTKMMKAQVLTVPELAQVPAASLDAAYVFTNGVEGMGPLGFQPDVFDSVPGSEGYSPLRALHLVTWKEGVTPSELKSVSDIQQAEAAGQVTITQPGVVVNMPVLVWPDGKR